MRFFQYTEIGEHDENEDAISVVPHVADSSAYICVLADGQGGQSGGAVAAQQAVNICIDKTQSLSQNELLNPFTWSEIGGFVDKSVALLSNAGYTTFIGIYVTSSFIVGVSSGDSAAILTVNGKVLTLTENQLKNPPIGSGAARLTPFSAVVDGSWKLILISDGVWKYSGWNLVFERCLSESGETIISSLREDVINQTKTLVDDFSVILVENIS